MKNNNQPTSKHAQNSLSLFYLVWFASHILTNKQLPHIRFKYIYISITFCMVERSALKKNRSDSLHANEVKFAILIEKKIKIKMKK